MSPDRKVAHCCRLFAAQRSLGLQHHHIAPGDGAAIVRIAPCDGKLCGAIARVLDPKAPPNAINNPDRRQRARPLAGVLVLRDFVHSGAEWKGGRAYDPKTGNSYTSELMVQQDGRLKVTGCILFLCRSRLWTRSD